MSFHIENQEIGGENRPYIVAEIGINARSDLALAESFIEIAAESGVDAVKFQTHKPDEEMNRSEMERVGAAQVYEVVTDAVLSRSDHQQLKSQCKNNGVTFLSTPFSTAAVDLLESINVSAIKIGSGELTNHELLARATEVGVPLLVSTGMSNESEVSSAVEFLKNRNAEFALLYCVSAYPADAELFDLSRITEMREQYDVPVGLSDHSQGIGIAPIAMGKGAAIIEKHFTLDRRLPGPDQEVSIEPDELERVVKFADAAGVALDGQYDLHEEEREIREWAGHSIVTTQAIAGGDKLDQSALTTKRPGTGISAARFFEILGRRITRDMDAGEILTESDLD